MAPGGANAPRKYDGSSLRIGIIHARWNNTIIDALVSGTKKALIDAGVASENIVTQTVPGSWELPIGVQRMYSASQLQSSSSSAGSLLPSATDLLSSTSMTDLSKTVGGTKDGASSSSKAPFDAVIAIGVLVKGETMHFEYIAESVSHGLMRVQLDSGIPVIFGLLTVLDEAQGLARAGLGGENSHNHGEDWGSAAVELGVKRAAWAKGEMLD